MCDFKPGDEVVCVDARETAPGWPLVEGRVYTVHSVGFGFLSGRAYLRVTLESHAAQSGWRASRFRRVQRKKTDLSIEAFLTIKPGFEEPRRVSQPKRKRERVS